MGHESKNLAGFVVPDLRILAFNLERVLGGAFVVFVVVDGQFVVGAEVMGVGTGAVVGALGW